MCFKSLSVSTLTIALCSPVDRIRSVACKVAAIVLWASFGIAVADDYAKEEAKRFANDYIGYSILDLPRYFMDASITVEASPDSPLLFSSKGRMKLISNDVGSYEECTWRPNVIADDRDHKIGRAHV